MFIEAGAIIAVAVAVVVAVTTLALRRSEANRRSEADRRSRSGVAGARSVSSLAGGMLAALPTWGGVLVTVVLLARGKVALAAVAAFATMVHTGVLRWRTARR